MRDPICNLINTRLAIILLALSLASAVFAAQTQDAEYEGVAEEYVKTYLAAHPLQGTALGLHEYDGKISDYSRLALDAELSRLRRFDRAARHVPRGHRFGRAIRLDRRQVPARPGDRAVDGPPDVDRGRVGQGAASRRRLPRPRDRPHLPAVGRHGPGRTPELAETDRERGARPGARSEAARGRGGAGSITRVEGFEFRAPRASPFSGRGRDRNGTCKSAVFLTHLEEARIAYLLRFDATVEEMILARAESRLSAPRCVPETSWRSGSGRLRSGRRASQLEYEVRSGDTVAAEATTVIVSYDYESGRPDRAARDLEGGPRRLMPVFERQTLSNGLRPLDCADRARAVRLLLRDARRGLALRDPGHERDRALLRAHVLQGHRAAPHGARHRERDRRHRRRIQRLHGQGVHGLLRALCGRAPVDRPRRARSTCSATRPSTPRKSSARRA